ncbi:MAG: hypothetical protein D6684_03545 [Deinococcus-Thermus bacterium]|uniref:hypothetical protein n=1 Tax=Meiothermus luteus TaxID=2026184 RepID=UPI000E6484FB|nr:hypothetical protein [Meiothermus luteus]RMH57504.1 MAG: hypothetical protein D6684_03545 [Deinococcota bacterium]
MSHGQNRRGGLRECLEAGPVPFCPHNKGRWAVVVARPRAQETQVGLALETGLEPGLGGLGRVRAVALLLGHRPAEVDGVGPMVRASQGHQQSCAHHNPAPKPSPAKHPRPPALAFPRAAPPWQKAA